MNVPDQSSKGLVYRLIDSLIFSNLFIALGATLISCATTLSIEGHWPDFYSWLSIFSGTLFIYASFRFFSIEKKKLIERGPMPQWLIRNRQITVFLMMLSLAICALCFFMLVRWQRWLLISMALASISYFFPIIHSGRKWQRSRDIPYLKVFIVAGVWAFVTVLLPLIAFGEVVWAEIGWHFAARYVFILAITMPFDIRDLKYDPGSGIMTFPMRFGASTTRNVALSLLFFFLGFEALDVCSRLGFDFAPEQLLVGLIPALLTVVVSAVLIFGSTEKRSEYWFTFLLDGTILLYSFAVIALHFLD